MLAKKTKHAITILFEAGGGATLPQFITGMNANEQMSLTALLTTANLLDCGGNLARPLEQISLYDILLATGEGIYPKFDEQLDYSGLPNKQQLYHSMIKQMLSLFKVSELGSL